MQLYLLIENGMHFQEFHEIRHMRAILILFFLPLFFQSHAQSSAPSADAVLRPVFAKANREGKNVLLIFHASWCGWCRKMDASLQDPSIKAAIDRNYEIAHLTVYESPANKELENPGAMAFLQKNGGADQGLPYWYVLDPKGNVLANSQREPGKNSGCPATVEEVDYFVNVLKKTSSLSEAELDAVRRRFRKNDQ